MAIVRELCPVLPQMLPRDEESDFTAPILSRKLLKKLVPRVGFEPTAYRLRSGCSTAELSGQLSRQVSAEKSARKLVHQAGGVNRGGRRGGGAGGVGHRRRGPGRGAGQADLARRGGRGRTGHRRRQRAGDGTCDEHRGGGGTQRGLPD